MIELDGLNYWAVLAAWVVNCAVGAYWYSQAGFAKQWAKLTNVDIMKIPTKEATKILLSVIISGLVQAFTLGVILNSLGVNTATEGILAGLLLWVGLTAATTVGVTLYQRRSWKFWWLNAGYFLIVMVVNSVIFAHWK